MKSNSSKKYLWIAIAVAVVLFSVTLIFSSNRKTPAAKASQDQNLPSLTSEELKKYNGTNPRLPIYLALDGNVYDVTKGSEFYKVGGSYHYLAGKDSSFELHIVGGDIIKKKYPVVGRLVSTK